MTENKSSTFPYRCHGCGAAYCKLWREYQTIASVTELRCANCVERDSGENFECDDPRKMSSIGWYVAAVPTPEGDTYWGYTSVPEQALKWWYALPNRPGPDNE